MNASPDQPHRRWNPLRGEWVLVSPHRTKRPWQGQTEPVAETRPAYDPDCYLCPGNERAGGVRNEDYADTFVFANDFAALLPDPGSATAANEDDPLFRSAPVAGECRVVCFSPRHDLTLARMPAAAIRRVVDLWAAQSAELGERWRWVQIFENKGAAMGCSNPHPHGQIWAGDFLPNDVAKEDAAQTAHLAQHGSPLLLDYARKESGGERVVTENEHWLAVVPYWAVWPFETLLLPKAPARRLEELSDERRDALAATMRSLLVRYDNLFQCSFPYSMGWHGAPGGPDRATDPADPGASEPWTLHAHFYPPLLRSASVKKFMVGYELLAEAQRDLTAEQAAARLREAGDAHYLEKA